MHFSYTFERSSFRCGIHTCTSFYFKKSTFYKQNEFTPVSFLSHMSYCDCCDWSVKNVTLLYRLESYLLVLGTQLNKQNIPMVCYNGQLLLIQLSPRY